MNNFRDIKQRCRLATKLCITDHSLSSLAIVKICRPLTRPLTVSITQTGNFGHIYHVRVWVFGFDFIQMKIGTDIMKKAKKKMAFRELQHWSVPYICYSFCDCTDAKRKKTSYKFWMKWISESALIGHLGKSYYKTRQNSPQIIRNMPPLPWTFTPRHSPDIARKP